MIKFVIAIALTFICLCNAAYIIIALFENPKIIINFISPMELYEKTNLNFFGVAIVWLLSAIIFIVPATLSFIKFILTVGRDNE